MATGGELPFPCSSEVDTPQNRYEQLCTVVDRTGEKLPADYEGELIVPNLLDSPTFKRPVVKPLYERLSAIMKRRYAYAPPKKRDDFCKFVTHDLLRYKDRLPADQWLSCDFLKDDLQIRLVRKPDSEVEKIFFSIFRATEGVKEKLALDECLTAKSPRVCRTFERDPNDQYTLCYQGQEHPQYIPTRYPWLIVFDGENGVAIKGLCEDEVLDGPTTKDDVKKKD